MAMSICRPSVRLFVCLSPVKFVKPFAKLQYLAGAYRIDSDTRVSVKPVMKMSSLPSS